MTNLATVKSLRKRYEKAVEDGEKQFIIEGFELLTAYAKYLLEYSKMRKIPDDIQLRTLFQNVDENRKPIK